MEGDGVQVRDTFEQTSDLTLTQRDSEKGRGVYCDDKAKEYKVWLATFLYYLTSICDTSGSDRPCD